jgi:hypothetical protein
MTPNAATLGGVIAMRLLTFFGLSILSWAVFWSAARLLIAAFCLASCTIAPAYVRVGAPVHHPVPQAAEQCHVQPDAAGCPVSP